MTITYNNVNAYTTLETGLSGHKRAGCFPKVSREAPVVEKIPHWVTFRGTGYLQLRRK